ncbi:cysteine-rich secretory protein 2 [Trichonephila clavipes]|nr:cysteine-rich secretory protein 2 [Trichonephila clavipes]
MQNDLSDPLEIKNGVRQGDAPACLLFNLALEKVGSDLSGPRAPSVRGRPKLYGKAIAHRDLDTRYANTKKKIVLIHNFYRARVNPPAKNMLEMTWHKGAQEAAQKWAGACQFLLHDKPINRWVEDYGSCGQNIFISNVEVDWMFVAKAWYSEHQNFTLSPLHITLDVFGLSKIIRYQNAESFYSLSLATTSITNFENKKPYSANFAILRILVALHCMTSVFGVRKEDSM